VQLHSFLILTLGGCECSASPQPNLMCIGLCIVVIDEEENQLVATQYFIELVRGSTCFGHHYAHCQELETMPLITT
jgi:hypothetical protein